MTAVKLCKDCKYFKDPTGGHALSTICRVPLEVKEKDLIYGERLVNKIRSCVNERDPKWGAKDDHCGYIGKYFKPKEGKTAPLQRELKL